MQKGDDVKEHDSISVWSMYMVSKIIILHLHIDYGTVYENWTIYSLSAWVLSPLEKRSSVYTGLRIKKQ